MPDQPPIQLVAALAAAAAEFPAIARDREVTVTPRERGGSYTFKYATLEAIMTAVRRPLSKHGLVLTHLLEPAEGRGMALRTILLHTSGERLDSLYPLPEPDGNPQRFGSALTYARRYSTAALLGIAADDDDDGNVAAGNAMNAVKDSVRAGPRPPAPPADQAVADLRAAINDLCRAYRNAPTIDEAEAEVLSDFAIDVRKRMSPAQTEFLASNFKSVWKVDIPPIPDRALAGAA